MNDLTALKGLTKKEKLMIIEALWDDIASDENEIESPDWHSDSLSKTKERLKAGEEKILDWTEAKRELRKRFE